MPLAFLLVALVAGMLIAAQRSGALYSTVAAFMPDRPSTSLAGIDQLTRLEGLRLDAYQDVAGRWTIGYGHLLLPGESHDSITEEQARAYLAGDLQTAENAVNTLVGVTLSQAQFDALVSFTYNEGVSAFSQSTLLSKLNDGDFAGAAAEFPRWNLATVDGRKVVINGLVKRRAIEQRLFATGTYS